MASASEEDISAIDAKIAELAKIGNEFKPEEKDIIYRDLLSCKELQSQIFDVQSKISVLTEQIKEVDKALNECKDQHIISKTSKQCEDFKDYARSMIEIYTVIIKKNKDTITNVFGQCNAFIRCATVTNAMESLQIELAKNSKIMPVADRCYTKAASGFTEELNAAFSAAFDEIQEYKAAYTDSFIEELTGIAGVLDEAGQNVFAGFIDTAKSTGSAAKICDAVMKAASEYDFSKNIAPGKEEEYAEVFG